MKTKIYIQTQHEGIHYWEKAPEDVGFLKYPHRHLFKVKVIFEVSHNDRQLEFFQIKRKLDKFLRDYFYDSSKEYIFPLSKSCEMIAEDVFTHFIFEYKSIISVEVSEDGENGSIVTI